MSSTASYPSCASTTSLSSGSALSSPSAGQTGSRCLNCAACASCSSSSSASTPSSATSGSCCGSSAPPPPFLTSIRRTLVLAAIFGEVAHLATDEAGLSAGGFALVAAPPAASVVLQLDLDLPAVEQGAVESESDGAYSCTAEVASSPSLNSMKAKEYLLL